VRRRRQENPEKNARSKGENQQITQLTYSMMPLIIYCINEKYFCVYPILVLKVCAESPKLTEYRTYLEYELQKAAPVRIQCLYERALKDNCLVGDMWIEYTGYLVCIKTNLHVTTDNL
jgi:hypothetical protein